MMGNSGYFFLTFITIFQFTTSFARTLNLHYVSKSFKVDGEGIVDCINIYKQPAFSHPLLKNHTLQVKPTMQRNKLASKEDNSIFSKSYEKCPVGYIPIKRSQNSNLLKTRPILPIRKSYSLEGHKYAVITAGSPKAGPIHGGRGNFNIWKPEVKQGGFSLSQIWLAAGKGSQLNTMEAGWQVNRPRTGDDNPRFFIYWTSDGYESTGCYDLSCPGFVQTNRNFIMGTYLNPSTYKGQQRELRLSIQKDEQSGNWWLYVRGNEVGYWPSALFTSIANSAEIVEYGGEIYEPTLMTQDTNTVFSTQMGSGHFPTEGFRHSSYVCDFTYTDSNGAEVHPNPSDLKLLMTSPQCYDLRMTERDHQPYFYFGGPGCGAL